MPYQFHAPQATANFVTADGSKCENRSLFQDRYAAPLAKEADRKNWYKALISKNAIRPNNFHFPNATHLHARLAARMMVNQSDGVMENAHVCLDRYGMPYIPGTATKGCARRMALQALRDWVTAGTDRPAADDACAPCCEDFKTPADMLAAIAHIFGWTPEDWLDGKNKDGHHKSDFAWASSALSTAPTAQPIPAQGNALGAAPPMIPSPEWAVQTVSERLASARSLLSSHKHFAGTIAFLSAFPNKDPGLELDVLTPHHTAYYEGNTACATAPDTEDPVPVFFPVVKPQKLGEYFTFSLQALRLAHPSALNTAKLFLAHGLELFGMGAKTHVGYGYFQIVENGVLSYANRFQPRLSPVVAFLSQWNGKPINSMNVRSFAKLIADFDTADIVIILNSIAPGKTDDFKDPFWNPFKSDSNAKSILDKIRTTN